MGVRLRASFAHVFLHCPISATLIRQYPAIDEGSPFTDKGIRLHDIGASLLKDKYGIPRLGLEYPASKTEMIDVMKYVQFVGQVTYDVFEELDDVTVEVEYEIDTSPVLIEGTGYIDYLAYNARRLLVVDYKSGFVRVFPKDNPQVYTYALSALYELEKRGITPREIFVAIAQPSQRNTTMHSISKDDLIAWHERNKQAIEDAYNGVETYNPGPQCEQCPFKGTCKAYLEYKLQQAKGVHDAH